MMAKYILFPFFFIFSLFAQCPEDCLNDNRQPVISKDIEHVVSICSKVKFLGDCNCEKISSSWRCTGKFFESGYPNPVTIIIPAAYTFPSKPNIHLFLHGHRLPWLDFNQDVLNRFNFEKMPGVYSSTDQLLVIPHSNGKCSDYEKYFGGNGSPGLSNRNFGKFLSALSQNIGDIERIKISSHSGAYRALSGILTPNTQEGKKWKEKINAITYYDSTYTTKTPVIMPTVDFYNSHPDLNLKIFYNANAPTKAGAELIASKIKCPPCLVKALRDSDYAQLGQKLPKSANPHYEMVNKLFGENY